MRVLPLIFLALASVGCSGEGVTRYTYNLGAQCEIASVDPSALPHTLNTEVNGLHVRHSDGTETILIAGRLPPNAFVLLHESQHHMEAALAGYPVALAIARHAFREYMTNSFEIGNADLLTETP